MVFSMRKFTREFHEDMVTLHGFLEGTLSLLLGLVNVHFFLFVNCELLDETISFHIFICGLSKKTG